METNQVSPEQSEQSTVEAQSQPQPFPTLKFDPEVPTVKIDGQEGLWVTTFEDGDRSVFIRKEAWDQNQRIGCGTHVRVKNALGSSCVHGEHYGNDKDINLFQPISVFDGLKARYSVKLFKARMKCRLVRWLVGKDRMAKIMLHAYL